MQCLYTTDNFSRSRHAREWFWNLSNCYCSIPLALGLIGRDGGLSTLCHSCGFACQQRVLKTFPGPDYLRSEDGVVWLWHSLVNLYIYIYIYIYIYTYPTSYANWTELSSKKTTQWMNEMGITRLQRDWMKFRKKNVNKK